MRADPTGEFWEWIIPFIVIPLLFTGCQATESDDEVLVIGTAEWGSSSQTMEKDLANAIGTTKSSTVVASNDSFATNWNNTTANYVAIHTHGAAYLLTDKEGFDFNLKDAEALSQNNNINYLIITACGVGGSVMIGYNMGQMLSTKISPTGYVICATTAVSGNDKQFTPTNGGTWVVYQNGKLVCSNIKATISMAYIISYINEHFK